MKEEDKSENRYVLLKENEDRGVLITDFLRKKGKEVYMMACRTKGMA